VAYNPNVLRDVLRARSLSKSELSRRLGIRRTDLEAELERDPEPRQGLLNEIAKQLALPAFVFFMERTPQLHDVLPDFRSPVPSPTAKSRPTIEAIQFGEGIQRALTNVDARGAPRLPRFSATSPQGIDDFALRAREFFRISVEDQASAKDAREFYVLCRKRIEDRGIFVFHDSFPETEGSGFCLFHPRYPVIVVNTKQQTRGRRLFTLIHELGHVLMQQSGISDPFVRENDVEKRCNRFAGAFLVPKTYATKLLGRTPGNDPDFDEVRWASRKLKISQEATVLRLEQIQLYKAGSHEKWKRIVHNMGNPDFSEKGGGAKEPPPQEKVKLAKYGFRFAQAFEPLLKEGALSEINLYRSTGLKPKYQRSYFDYARSLTAGDLATLDVDDG
jgi:Zn-dependent peptidase ImmA (M78 family)